MDRRAGRIEGAPDSFQELIAVDAWEEVFSIKDYLHS